MGLHGRRRPRLPSRHDWIDYLDSDLERRDRRQAFLWALTLSLGAVGVALTRVVPWGKDPTLPIQWISAAGVAAALYMLVARRFTDRLLHAINPNTMFVDFSLRTALGFVRYVRAFGVSASSRMAAVPTHLAQVLLGVSLITVGAALGPWAWVAWILGVTTFASGAFFLLFLLREARRHTYVAFLLATMILKVLRLGLDEKNLRRYPTMVRELEDASMPPPFLAAFFPKPDLTAKVAVTLSLRSS